MQLFVVHKLRTPDMSHQRVMDDLHKPDQTHHKPGGGRVSKKYDRSECITNTFSAMEKAMSNQTVWLDIAVTTRGQQGCWLNAN